MLPTLLPPTLDLTYATLFLLGGRLAGLPEQELGARAILARHGVSVELDPAKWPQSAENHADRPKNRRR